ncbi:hypothetical protein [Microtetraspora sp. NBRC 16547]|uniref:hypothetical protein n=1 Tax=Microtetraspora sp. NBRC 16547 TaxID=3030993 RepID=UPI0024A12FF6|nr:hypothetical protein [Microtetraspora sp. NBRC 16547]GLX01750.1 hypothetical protein Misp02_58360 [Microtetraspora sp. NBRC 16547]
MTTPLTGQRTRSELIAELYERHAAGLFAYCHDQLGETSSAADAVVSVFTGVPTDPSPARAALYALARREIYRRDVSYALPAVDSVADPATALIERVFRDIRPHQREVLLLSAVCGLTTSELSWVFEVATDTAAELTLSARRRFSQTLITATTAARSAPYVPVGVAEVYDAIVVSPIEDVLARLPWRRPAAAVRARVLSSLPMEEPGDSAAVAAAPTTLPTRKLWPTTPAWPLPLTDPNQVTNTCVLPAEALAPPQPGRRSKHEATTEPMPRLRPSLLAAFTDRKRRAAQTPASAGEAPASGKQAPASAGEAPASAGEAPASREQASAPAGRDLTVTDAPPSTPTLPAPPALPAPRESALPATVEMASPAAETAAPRHSATADSTASWGSALYPFSSSDQTPSIGQASLAGEVVSPRRDPSAHEAFPTEAMPPISGASTVSGDAVTFDAVTFDTVTFDAVTFDAFRPAEETSAAPAAFPALTSFPALTDSPAPAIEAAPAAETRVTEPDAVPAELAEPSEGGTTAGDGTATGDRKAAKQRKAAAKKALKAATKASAKASESSKAKAKDAVSVPAKAKGKAKPGKRRERHYDWAWELVGFLICVAIALIVFFSMPTFTTP